jgi:type VI protein secretion system component VasK
MRTLFKIWTGFTQLIGLILPFFARAGNLKGWGPGARWIVRFFLLTLIVVLLWFINYRWFRPEIFIGNAPSQFVGTAFLPILFLLTVCLSWLGYLLWKLLTPEAESSDFPDIDAAWDEARSVLNDAGIDLTEAPLFFILGRPASTEEALMQASQVPLTVRQTPARPDAPLHLFANRDGIYVTCPGASLMGRQCHILTREENPTDVHDGPVPERRASEDDPIDRTMGPDDLKTLRGKGGEVQHILARVREERRLATPQENKRIRQLLGIPRRSLLKDSIAVEELTARLNHLCRLIVRDRRPYCPVNGVLVIIPLAAADSEDDADQTGDILHRDLATMRKAFQVHCPVIAMVCDLEMAPGFREFFERFPDRQRQRRVGQRFPLVPAVEPAALPGMIENGVHWICRTLFPTWVYKFFRVEGPGREDMSAQVASNTQLYKLMNEMRQRSKPLARVLTRGFLNDHSGPLLFGGCYVTATGGDAAREQAFTAGVFRRLVDEQNYVSWTADAIADEADYQRWTKFGYVAVAVFAVIILALGIFFVTR